MNADPGAARRRRTAGFGAIAVAAALLTSSCAAGRVAQTQNQRPSVSGVNADVGSISVRDLTVEAPQGASYPKGSALRIDGVFVDNGTAGDVLTDISSPSFTSWGAYSSITDGDQVVAAAAASAAGSTPPSAASPAPTSATNSSPGSTPSPVPSPTSASASASSSTASPVASTPAAPPTPSAPQASRTVRIPANGRTSFGVPDATGSLLALSTKSTIFPGSLVTMTLTFAKAGTVTVRVPVDITSDPTQSVVPAPSTGGEGGEGS